jgi:hypothetical protein
MPNKTRNWTDVELIVSSISIAVTLGFWSMFSSREKVGVGVDGQVSLTATNNTASSTAASAGVIPAPLPGQPVYFSATGPQAAPPAVVQQKPRRRSGGGGGGGGGASTGSS